MPYQSDAQRRLMQGIQHGWHPTGMKRQPSKAVAEKFHEEDKAARKRRMMAKALRQS